MKAIVDGTTSIATRQGLEAYRNCHDGITIHREDQGRGADQYIALTAGEAKALIGWITLLLGEMARETEA